MNYLRDYAHSYTDERLKIKNDHKGKAYLYAIIYDRHRCYSVGINHYNHHDPFDTIHAEVDAVFQLKKNEKVKKVNMLVCRVNRNKHELCNAKPCIHCMRYIERNLKRKNFRLKNRRCYYTDEEGNFKCINI